MQVINEVEVLVSVADFFLLVCVLCLLLSTVYGLKRRKSECISDLCLVCLILSVIDVDNVLK